MSYNEGTVVCPLCQTRVPAEGGGDALQLHYLTNCSGYDKVPSERPPKAASQEEPPSTTKSFLDHTSATVDLRSSAASASVSPSYYTPGSTSLSTGRRSSVGDSAGATSGDSGDGSTSSVQFMWQPLSDISYPSITLLASFKGGSVDLKLDPDGGHYASQFTSIPKGTYEGQLVIGDSFMHPVKKFTIEKDDDIVVLQFEVADRGEQSRGDLDRGYSSHYSSQYGSGCMQKNPSYNQPSTSYSYQNPAFGGGLSSGQRTFSEEKRSSNYHGEGFSSAYGQPTLDTAESERRHGQYSTNSSQSFKSRSAASQLSGNISLSKNDINIPLDSSSAVRPTEGSRNRLGDGFSVKHLHQEKEGDVHGDELQGLRSQLEAVTQEKNELHRNQERVNAQWEGRVRRLERQLQAQEKGEKPAESDTEASLRDARSTIADLERQLAALRKQRSEDSQSVRDNKELRKQLDEMKDRNTALEQQLLEYGGTMQDQAKAIQSLKSSGASGDGAVLQQMVHKQQVEYSEAINNLRKRIDYADKVAQENTQTHQINVKLAGELEDYRSQTKRLIHDIQQKDEEIASLKQALAQSSNDAVSLELATLKQKLSAWQEEVEKLAHQRERAEQLESEQAQIQASNVDLCQRIQQLESDYDKSQRDLAKKASDYNTLNERFAELQETRVSLENELQPLREERAKILRENALLLEGSDPEKHVSLKREYEALQVHCKQLELALEEQSSLLSAHQESNVVMQQQLEKATDQERLQSIRTRMERYKQERDVARSRTEDVEQQLVTNKEEQERLAKQVLEASEESVKLHEELQQQKLQQEKTSRKLADVEVRMQRYRSERNMAVSSNRILKQQMETLESTISDLLAQTGQQNPADYLQSLTEDFDSMVTTEMEDTAGEDEPRHKNLASASPTTDDYQPQLYSTDNDQGSYRLEDEQIHPPAPVDREPMAGATRAGVEQGVSLASDHVVEVQTKDGVEHVRLVKPSVPLNAKDKPTVIVKRGADYQSGTLMFVGNLGGKDMAGIWMSLRQHRPSTSTAAGNQFTDGTYKDGKRYFKCPKGHGIYVPSSKVFLKDDII